MDFFDEAYRGVPPWDVGRPQPPFVEAEARGEIKGRIIDLGCGTGENALHYASRGHEVVGVDGAPRAIEKAKAKAKERRLKVEFRVADALHLPKLEPFDAATDSGLFHVFADAERPVYAESVRGILRPGGTLHVLCFSDKEPGDWGPRRVRKEELRSTFKKGWREIRLEASRFANDLSDEGSHAWFAAFERT